MFCNYIFNKNEISIMFVMVKQADRPKEGLTY